MSNLLIFDRDNLPEAEVSRPAPDRLIDGDPVFSTWVLDTAFDETTFAGIWAATVGAWRVSYDEWEYCTIVEGIAEVSEDGGQTHRLKAGDHFIFHPGFSGTWRVIAPVTKTFVVIVK
jgi:hypothetical protein